MSDTDFEMQVLSYLQRIDRHLFALAEEKLVGQRSRLESRYLTTEARQRMWGLMDGRRTLTEIGRAAGVTTEAVRQFVNELATADQPVVELASIGHTRVPRRLI